ncbi:MAG: ACT domain-containing protein [Clostridiales bacterium]|nr:ACT domain-containing protein [Clostridiales bacterium]
MPAKSVKTISLIVDNEFGVLTRITALVRREGFNIISLAVTVTDNPELSRAFIAVECIQSAFPKVLERLRKLACVRTAEPVSSQLDLTAALGRVFAEMDIEGGASHA